MLIALTCISNYLNICPHPKISESPLVTSLARMAEDLFVRPDGKPMTFLMGSSQEKKQVRMVSLSSLLFSQVVFFICIGFMETVEIFGRRKRYVYL